MFGLLAWPLFVGFEPTITFLERRNRRTVLWSQGTHSTLETFVLKADKEVQRITLSWTLGRCMALTVCRAVPVVFPRTAPQHIRKMPQDSRPISQQLCLHTSPQYKHLCRNAHGEVSVPLCEVKGVVVTVATGMLRRVVWCTAS
jgi:hypothetical protein